MDVYDVHFLLLHVTCLLQPEHLSTSIDTPLGQRGPNGTQPSGYPKKEFRSRSDRDHVDLFLRLDSQNRL